LIEIHNPIAERYLYLPLVGFCMVISILINAVPRRSALTKSKNPALLKYSILIGLLIFYSLVTVTRNPVWKDNFSVWANTVEKSPDNPIVHGGLGLAYQQRGFLDEAIEEFTTAIELGPNMAKNHYNLVVPIKKKDYSKMPLMTTKKLLNSTPDTPMLISISPIYTCGCN